MLWFQKVLLPKIADIFRTSKNAESDRLYEGTFLERMRGSPHPQRSGVSRIGISPIALCLGMF